MSMKVTRAEFIGIEHMDENELRDFAWDILAENETLRAERDEWHRVAESKQDIIDHMRDANVENAELRSDLLLAQRIIGQISHEGFELIDDNKKLRELASEAHSCKTNDGCCEDCYCDEGCCPIERRMQELGIEVG